MSAYYNPELYHHGVKGMKWGRRKASYDTEPGGLYSRNRIPKDAKTDGYQKSKLPGPVMGGPTMNKQGNAVKNAAKSAASMTKNRIKRVERADQNIKKIESRRKLNKLTYDAMNITAKTQFKGNDKKIKRNQASNKALYDSSEVANKYAIAKQKAKKDKSYKNSEEYKQAKAAFGKHQTQRFLYGELGHHRIETLKNQGSSERAAKGRTAAEQLLAGAAIGGMIVGVQYLTRK